MAQDYPGLNVLINNAGIMKIVTTSLFGPIRLTAALLPLLQSQLHATVLTVSPGLAFVPLAETPTYCVKAAIHSYSVSLRHQLKGTTTELRRSVHKCAYTIHLS